jgi:hypothetical protein
MHPHLIKLLAEAHGRDLARLAQRHRLAFYAKATQRRPNSAKVTLGMPISGRGERRVPWLRASVESVGTGGAG